MGSNDRVSGDAAGEDHRAVIIGAGPVGCVLALEFAHHGISTLVLERSEKPPVHPKMDYLSGRTMEHLRRLGVAAAVRHAAIEEIVPSYIRWFSNLTEPPIAAWHHAAPAEHRSTSNNGSDALEPYARVRGSLLEAVLREEVRRHPLAELRLGCTVTAVDQDESGVTLQVSGGSADRVSGSYVIGCDGAGSIARRSLGVGLDVAGEPRKNYSLYFSSSDPVLRVHGRSFIQVFGGGVTLVSRDDQQLWTASFPVAAVREGEEPFATLARLVGHEIDIETVHDVTSWTGMLAVADRYRVGRVFLAGDACHQFFPTGGHGANTGIGDAVDLGWKLAATMKGWAGPALLDSYEAERRPVAEVKREFSANLLEVWQRFRRLCAVGAAPELVAGFLAAQEFQHNNLGVHFADRYAGSPVIVDRPMPHDWRWGEISRTVRPGRRVPSVRLEDGSELFDHLPPALTLVDPSPDEAGRVLMGDPLASQIGLRYLRVTDRSLRLTWGTDLVIVRPDQHVAWVGDGKSCGASWSAILRTVSGQA